MHTWVWGTLCAPGALEFRRGQRIVCNRTGRWLWVTTWMLVANFWQGASEMAQHIKINRCQARQPKCHSRNLYSRNRESAPELPPDLHMNSVTHTHTHTERRNFYFSRPKQSTDYNWCTISHLKIFQTYYFITIKIIQSWRSFFFNWPERGSVINSHQHYSKEESASDNAVYFFNYV